MYADDDGHPTLSAQALSWTSVTDCKKAASYARLGLAALAALMATSRFGH